MDAWSVVVDLVPSVKRAYPWVEVAPAGPTVAGDTGGELQTTEAYCRRWICPAPELGEWLTVTVETWGEAQDEWSCVSERLEYIRCTDPADPGSTELWAGYSDINYVRGAEVSDEGAYKACAEFELGELEWIESGDPT